MDPRDVITKDTTVSNVKKRKGGGLGTLLPLFLMGGHGSLFGSGKNPLKGIDIDKEYKLIQRKKSKLSANLRARVVNVYESRKGDRDNG